MSDAVQSFLSSAGRIPLLTASEEIILGNQIMEWRQAENPDRRLQRRGERALQRMMAANMKLVVNVAKRYTKRLTDPSLSLEDLIQEGCIGLERGCSKFDPTKGYKASTYLYWWISQAISRRIEMQGTIRRPASVSWFANRWRYRPEGQTVEQFAEEHDKSVEWVQNEICKLNRSNTTSLNLYVQQDDARNELGTLLPDPASEIDLEDFDRRYAIEALEDALPADLELIKAESNGMKHKELAGFVGCKPGKALQRELAAARERLQSAYHGLPAITYSEPESCQNVGTPCLEPMPDVSLNGHHHQSLEQEAAAVIAEVQAEAEPKAEPQRKRRTRRTKGQIAADRAAKASPLMTVIANGVELTGPPEVIASLVLQMSHAKAA